MVDGFDNISDGFWWTIITMTSVGYGDIYPKSHVGKLIGATVALFGVLLCGLTVPIISNDFTFYYNFANIFVYKLRDRKLFLRKQRIQTGESNENESICDL